MTELKILIVEDDESTASLIGNIFAGYDCEVTIADNGQDALTKAWAIEPDVIILDIVMYPMSGIEFLGELKKKGSAFPVYVLTGYREHLYRTEIESVQYPDLINYVYKPVDGERIGDIVSFFKWIKLRGSNNHQIHNGSGCSVGNNSGLSHQAGDNSDGFKGQEVTDR